MYAVNISLGATVWRLLFRDIQKAKNAFDSFKEIPVEVGTVVGEDDFGQHCVLDRASINGVMFEDLDQSKLANIELFLHQQRVQVAAQKAAQADPGLRASTAMNSPSVLTPFRQN
jgi:hypothetical protein